MSLDIDHLRQWIGRSEEASDILTPQLVRRLRATLFRDPIDAPDVPLTAHWCLAPPVVPHGELAKDGHPAKGGFLPPVPLPRRMWAGGKLEFIAPLRVGDEVSRVSTIGDVSVKQGSTGTLCFVTVNHDIRTARGTAIRERQDIVYREPAPAGAAAKSPAPAKAASPVARHSRTHQADEVALFRYSAVTFNGHRIHYDGRYVVEDEGYAGLVVHGPLQAALLVEYAADLKGGRAPAAFEYRGVQPLIAGAPFTVNASETDAGLDIWSAGASGEPTMKGQARW